MHDEGTLMILNEKRRLSSIATAQRIAICALLGHLEAIPIAVVAGAVNSSDVLHLSRVIGFCGSAVTLYGATVLANRLWGTPAAVGCLVGAMFPLVNVLVLHLLFSRANKPLREGGASVGFLGADPAQFA